MGNDALLGLPHKAQVQFLAHQGLIELDIDGQWIVMADGVIVCKSGAFLAETLVIAVAVTNFNRYSCDFVYRVSKKTSGRRVVLVKACIAFFNYQQHAIQNVSQLFLDLFSSDVIPA